MSEIKTLVFGKEHFSEVKAYSYGNNWPVVYIIDNEREIYIGQTTNMYSRCKQHFENPLRTKLNRIHIITDEEYNVSAALDIESLLIQYIAADGKYVLQNGNLGLVDHNYFDKPRYRGKFDTIWNQLKQSAFVINDWIQIRNSDLFKYSPYKALSGDQLETAELLMSRIRMGVSKTYIVNGDPGTGKTILATYLMKALQEDEHTKHLKIALIVPMTSLRHTLKKVFKNVKGLKPNMVIGPNDLSRNKYDVLLVDEAHRLKKRKNISNYGSFDKTNKMFGLDNNGTELDWILQSSQLQVLFYDKNQTVRPSDIDHKRIESLNAEHLVLKNQQRIIDGGEEYLEFAQNLFDLNLKNKKKFSQYDFKIYDHISEMVNAIKLKDKELSLCRIISGFSWPWVSKNKPGYSDIDIEGYKLQWNSVNHNWVNSPNAVNEVGCIHTVQGYDLNYAGVIVGPELSYDKEKKKLVVHAENYKDSNGKRGIDDPKELERYIINIYKTLFTRGIRGTYVYIVDKDLRDYVGSKILV